MVESTVSFWQMHPSGILLLIGLAFFPRITTLFIGGPFGRLHWFGWLIAPHLLVAVAGLAAAFLFLSRPVRRADEVE